MDEYIDEISTGFMACFLLFYLLIPTYLHTTILIHDNTIVTIVKIPHTLVF